MSTASSHAQSCVGGSLQPYDTAGRHQACNSGSKPDVDNLGQSTATMNEKSSISLPGSRSCLSHVIYYICSRSIHQ